MKEEVVRLIARTSTKIKKRNFLFKKNLFNEQGNKFMKISASSTTQTLLYSSEWYLVRIPDSTAILLNIDLSPASSTVNFTNNTARHLKDNVLYKYKYERRKAHKL